MPDPIRDPLTDPRVIAARARVTDSQRIHERFAEVTAEADTATLTATMRIYGRIDRDGAPWGINAQDVADALDTLPEGTKRLDVHVHSRGGDAFEGLAILNMLRQAKTEVHVVVDGLAASAASAIAMAGKTIAMSPSSTLMIHDASGIGIGQAEDLRILAAALDSVSESYAAAYASRAGGEVAEWRAAMQPETWYRADEAVKAGLADSVLATAPPHPTASFDLSVFAHAGRDAAPDPFIPAARAAHKPPATAPEQHPTPKEAVNMTEEELKALRASLGLPEDADAAAIQAKITELEEAATTPPEPPAITDEALAAHFGVDVAQVTAAIEAAKSGKVTVSQSYLDTLNANAEAGVKALARQEREDRDAAITAAQDAGKIGRDEKTVASWQRDWDRDSEATKAELDALPARFPVGPGKGYEGGEDAGADDDYVALFGDEKTAVSA